MQDLPPATLEGKMIAQRRMIAQILAVLIENAADDRLADLLLDVRDLPLDQQEDPGAVPDPAMAVQGAVIEELRLIADEARRLMAERKADGTA
ncbi:hypothetical protein [Halodurantibacterium flavum]|uniref:Uncharacterized protein n=1 Tax=Halodurantibacterium flavum TaxID=1382802 RepID=A0ABW4S3V7_9RHOB